MNLEAKISRSGIALKIGENSIQKSSFKLHTCAPSCEWHERHAIWKRCRPRSEIGMNYLMQEDRDYKFEKDPPRPAKMPATRAGAQYMLGVDHARWNKFQKAASNGPAVPNYTHIRCLSNALMTGRLLTHYHEKLCLPGMITVDIPQLHTVLSWWSSCISMTLSMRSSCYRISFTVVISLYRLQFITSKVLGLKNDATRGRKCTKILLLCVSIGARRPLLSCSSGRWGDRNSKKTMSCCRFRSTSSQRAPSACRCPKKKRHTAIRSSTGRCQVFPQFWGPLTLALQTEKC